MNHNNQICLLLPGKLLQPDFPGLTGIKAVGHQSPVLIELRRLALIVQNQKCLLQLFSNSLNVNRKNQICSVFRFHVSRQFAGNRIRNALTAAEGIRIRLLHFGNSPLRRRIDPDFRCCRFFRPKEACNGSILSLVQIHLRNHKELSSIPGDFLCMQCFLFGKSEHRDRRSISAHAKVRIHAVFRIEDIGIRLSLCIPEDAQRNCPGMLQNGMLTKRHPEGIKEVISIPDVLFAEFRIHLFSVCSESLQRSFRMLRHRIVPDIIIHKQKARPGFRIAADGCAKCRTILRLPGVFRLWNIRHLCKITSEIMKKQR